MAFPPKPLKYLVRVKGLEPPLPYGKQILSLPRLPFRHTRAGHANVYGEDTRLARTKSALAGWNFAVNRLICSVFSWNRRRSLLVQRSPVCRG